MAPAPRPTTASSYSAMIAEVIGDIANSDLPVEDRASAIVIGPKTTKTALGTPAHKVLEGAREALHGKVATPEGLTLRADHGPVIEEDGQYSRTVTYYYGDPVKGEYPTDVRWIGVAPTTPDPTPSA